MEEFIENTGEFQDIEDNIASLEALILTIEKEGTCCDTMLSMESLIEDMKYPEYNPINSFTINPSSVGKTEALVIAQEGLGTSILKLLKWLSDQVKKFFKFLGKMWDSIWGDTEVADDEGDAKKIADKRKEKEAKVTESIDAVCGDATNTGPIDTARGRADIETYIRAEVKTAYEGNRAAGGKFTSPNDFDALVSIVTQRYLALIPASLIASGSHSKDLVNKAIPRVAAARVNYSLMAYQTPYAVYELAEHMLRLACNDLDAYEKAHTQLATTMHSVAMRTLNDTDDVHKAVVLLKSTEFTDMLDTIRSGLSPEVSHAQLYPNMTNYNVPAPTALLPKAAAKEFFGSTDTKMALDKSVEERVELDEMMETVKVRIDALAVKPATAVKIADSIIAQFTDLTKALESAKAVHKALPPTDGHKAITDEFRQLATDALSVVKANAAPWSRYIKDIFAYQLYINSTTLSVADKVISTSKESITAYAALDKLLVKASK